jgi:hypothetical protein
MQDRLEKLYNECIKELKSINIDVQNPAVGEIDIKIAKRNSKRYGCCKQELPDLSSAHLVKHGHRRQVQYDRYYKHHIEINKWVMDMDEKIIKNTIIHEIIHCFSCCNNHGKNFKKYANYINDKLGYNITRLGNKEADYKESNIEYKDDENTYKYEIICKQCGQVYYRKRLQKNFIRKYRCGKCRGKLEIK